MDRRRIKIALVASFVLTSLIAVAAQDTQKNGTSYAPVDIKETFGSIMARMKAAKASVMKRQMDLLAERYDLSKM